LRHRAEEALQVPEFERCRPHAGQELGTLLHELEVHQIELLMQQEQLEQSYLQEQESRRSYQELYEAMPIPYATIDATGRVYDFNPAAVSLLALKSCLKRFPHFQTFLGQEDRDRFILSCREVIRTQRSCTGELLFRRADGVSFEGALEIYPHHRKAMRLRVMFQDISMRKQNAILWKTLESVERGLVEITHEMKAPAGRVTEFASWIEHDYGQLLDSKGRKYLDWIKTEGEDLVVLAEGILELASITYQPPHVEPIDVGAVIREVVSHLERTRDKAIAVNVASDFPTVLCRRRHVKQVFHHLIENAFKYMGQQPHPYIEIGWLKSDSGIRFYVRDNGVGIDPSMVGKIFLPFVRLETVQAGGSGIGLSIVKEVLAEYNESVTVDSAPGLGSTFYVQFPECPMAPETTVMASRLRTTA
jgi:signal transduction histidine kinase